MHVNKFRKGVIMQCCLKYVQEMKIQADETIIYINSALYCLSAVFPLSYSFAKSACLGSLYFTFTFLTCSFEIPCIQNDVLRQILFIKILHKREILKTSPTYRIYRVQYINAPNQIYKTRLV